MHPTRQLSVSFSCYPFSLTRFGATDSVPTRSYSPYSAPLWNRFGVVFGCVYELRRAISISQNWLKGWKGRIWQLCLPDVSHDGPVIAARRPWGSPPVSLLLLLISTWLVIIAILLMLRVLFLVSSLLLLVLVYINNRLYMSAIRLLLDIIYIILYILIY